MTAAAVYSTVFAPELFVLLATLLLVGYEWRTSGWTARTVAVRLGAVVVAWALALAVYQGGPSLVSGPVPGGEDLYASAGLVAGFAVIWLVWSRQSVASAGPRYCLVLVATSVIHAAVVPVWNVSSHVLYAVVPTVYLATVDRRFAVLFVVPLGMVWSRVSVAAHSLPEAVAGLGLGLLVGASAVALPRLDATRQDGTES